MSIKKNLLFLGGELRLPVPVPALLEPQSQMKHPEALGSWFRAKKVLFSE